MEIESVFKEDDVLYINVEDKEVGFIYEIQVMDKIVQVNKWRLVEGKFLGGDDLMETIQKII
jgi:hypothetical protein